MLLRAARSLVRVCRFCTSCHAAGPSKPSSKPSRRSWEQRKSDEDDPLWTAPSDSALLGDTALSSFPLSELFSPEELGKNKTPEPRRFSPFLKDVARGGHPEDFGSFNVPSFRRHRSLEQDIESYNELQRGFITDMEQYITDGNLSAVIEHYNAFVLAHPRGAAGLPSRTIIRFSALLARTRPRTRALFQRLLDLLAIQRASSEPLRSWQWNSLADCAGRGSRSTTLEDYRAVVAVVRDMASDPNGVFKPDVITFNILLGAAARTGEHRAVQHALALMEASTISPDRITFLTLVPYYGRVGWLSRARDTLIAMTKEGWEVGVDGLTAAIWTWGQAGNHDLEVAIGIYHALRQNEWDGGASDRAMLRSAIPDDKNPVLNIPGLSPPLPPSLMPNRITYTVLIQCLCYHGDLVRALQVYRAYLSSPQELHQEMATKRDYLSAEETTVVIFRSFFLGFIRHCAGANTLSISARSLPPKLPVTSDLSTLSHLKTSFSSASFSALSTLAKMDQVDTIQAILEGREHAVDPPFYTPSSNNNPWTRTAFLAVLDSYIAALGETTPHQHGLWWILRAAAGTAEPGRESQRVREVWERVKGRWGNDVGWTKALGGRTRNWLRKMGVKVDRRGL
ncbi:PPR containing protein [Ceratobasidium sp. AG-Ba]|nr:PPR containing protein [Ceratobasidium sp. AG-Ba]